MRPCAVNGCERVHSARGLCNPHYQRWLKYGDPAKSAPKSTFTERFEAKVAGDGSGCLLWLAMVDDKGYGMVRRDGAMVKAHRAAWELYCGPIPPGLCVLHKCDTPPCVNPGHLFLGTMADNIADCVRKGRTAGQKKTACVAGHPLSGSNLYVHRGHRACRTCRGTLNRRAREKGLK